MRILKPSISIRPQAQTAIPVNGDNTIMDDTVMTMDGLALMGGPVTTGVAMRQTVVKIVPRAKIRIRR